MGIKTVAYSSTCTYEYCRYGEVGSHIFAQFKLKPSRFRHYNIYFRLVLGFLGAFPTLLVFTALLRRLFCLMWLEAIDETSGHRYSYNENTDETKWISGSDDEGEEGEVEEGE